jgi:hypothetical protein
MTDQRSVTEQLQDLIAVANQKGMYDAADYLLNVVTRTYKKEEAADAVAEPSIEVLSDYEERELFRNDLNSVITHFWRRTGCTYPQAKHVVLSIALGFGLIPKESIKPYMGHCRVQELPIKKGMTVTIKKGTIVKTIGRDPKPAGKTYKITVHHLGGGSNQYRGYHGEIVAAQNPTVVWAGPGGYWSECDLNDLPEAAS